MGDARTLHSPIRHRTSASNLLLGFWRDEVPLRPHRILDLMEARIDHRRTVWLADSRETVESVIVMPTVGIGPSKRVKWYVHGWNNLFPPSQGVIQRELWLTPDELNALLNTERMYEQTMSDLENHSQHHIEFMVREYQWMQHRFGPRN